MSIEIDWAKLTTGEDGAALAESIREFIHDKFQQVTLPGFIRSVEVHSFSFGDQCPTVVLKDVCDPLPDFYEDSESEDGDGDDVNDDDLPQASAGSGGDDDETTPYASMTLPPPPAESLPSPSRELASRLESTRQRRRSSLSQTQTQTRDPTARSRPLAPVDTHAVPPPPRLQSTASAGLAGHLASPLLSRSSTPGIPGGTANLSYFHLPLSARLQGSQIGLAAMAGAGGGAGGSGGNGNSNNGFGFSGGSARQQQDHHAHPWEHYPRRASPTRPQQQQQQQAAAAEDFSYGDPSTRPSTAHSYGPSLRAASSFPGGTGGGGGFGNGSGGAFGFDNEPDPSDLQVVLHIAYSGNVRLTLAAEILLDYPMPSFVGIPLELNITGLSFDGVALIAYLRRRAHFCFLGPDDAQVLVGAESKLDGGEEEGEAGMGKGTGEGMGGLLREIKVESEIGQKEGGKQVLKNVGKVEKFVLEQVRRIFEEEMVWPSFWTFLV